MASTSGRPSTPEGRRSSSSAPATVVVQPASYALAQDIIGRLEMGDVQGLRKLEKTLSKKGSSLAAAVAAVKPATKEVSDSLLHMAAEWGLYEPCKYLVKDLHLDVDAAGVHGATPVISAIDGIDPTNTLHQNYPFTKIVELLIRHGADLNKAKTNGFTAIHAAMVKGSCEILKLLLLNGAAVNAVCEKGTVLHLATDNGTSCDVIKFLIDSGADPNITNICGITALQLAVIKGSYEIAELLLSGGANVDAVSDGKTALHIAAEHSNSKMLRLLLKYHANVNIFDAVGRRPIEVAALKRCKDCVQILFPHPLPLDASAVWSVDEIIRQVQP